MAKRKKRSKKPNLPKATLERARAQARGEDYVPEYEDEVEDDIPEEEPEPEAVADDEEDDARASRRERRSSRRRSSPSAVQYSRRRGNNTDAEALDNAALGNMLARPTKFVSEEQLKEEYGYVVADVRNMFVLAGGLFVLLVVLAQFI